MSAPLHVIIVGGGIGGLTLAQGLKREGVSAADYERDRTPTDRLQGYRVHISPTGGLGLHKCLPPPLFEAFDRTCGSPTAPVRFSPTANWPGWRPLATSKIGDRKSFGH
jgi:phytoene dehydrogenase-like protein